MKDGLPVPMEKLKDRARLWSSEDRIMLATHDFIAALPGDPWRLLKTRGFFYVMTPDLMIEVRRLPVCR